MSDGPIVFLEREARSEGFWPGFFTGLLCAALWTLLIWGIFSCFSAPVTS